MELPVTDLPYSISNNYVDDYITRTDESGNTATVTIADAKRANGDIHVIDTALLQKG